MSQKELYVKFWREVNMKPIKSSEIIRKIDNTKDIEALIKHYKYLNNSPISKCEVSDELWNTLTELWNASAIGSSGGENDKYIYDSAHYKILVSVPEPEPNNDGVAITPKVINWLQQRGYDATTELILERQAYGLQKYGQSLMSNDGRNSIEDTRQELGDAIQYLMKIYVNYQQSMIHDLGILDEPIRALVELYQELKCRQK